MSLAIEGTIRRASATPKRCLYEWLLYSWAFFYWQPAQTSRRADQPVSQANSRARDATRARLTSSYISPHNPAARQIPLFVHILCIVTCIAGHPGSTNHFRRICSTSFSLLLLSPPPSSSLCSLSVDPACPRHSFSASSFAFYFLLLLYSPSGGGGWVEIVYLPDENHIGSCYERPLIMHIP